ncbi:dihydrolipoyl dehydrogenase [Paraliomyxa miuraensis]|uniref:dihydrolipoyl dehydrogenase n=1 Tax=Paraliomyxa miuraensis TaxID=376150 RepID=UPI002253EA57|nr:dihydrolipoyl dehydrogenase [Paraliomyxa miuraensis]MCX4243799.1 dihydrolipoyl dehydrogenase [Paraliomyxa miuraensis]
MSTSYDLIVIGAGPGGYVAAIRAAQLGMKVACVDENTALGGTCLRVGCIPSKALLESSERYYEARKGALSEHGISVGEVTLDLPALLARKDKVVSQLTSGVAFLFKKNGVTPHHGRGRLVGEGKVEVTSAEGSKEVLTAKHVLIATGSVPATIPGVVLDGDRIGTSTEALSFPQVPEHLVVIGAGYIGLEMGSVWARLGSKVTVLEYMSEFLPAIDTEIAKLAHRAFTKQGLQIQLGVRVTGARVEGDRVTVTYEEGGDQRPNLGPNQRTVEGDRVLVATGRRPNTEGLGASELGVKLDRRGFIEVDDHYRTAVPGVWAIGDVIPGPMLAHKAEEEGVAAVEHMAGLPGHVNYDAIPGIIYTHPEVAGVGKTEQQLRADGVPYKKGTFPFSANGRAKAMAETDGMVKILAHAETDRILGFHVIGPHASDLAAEGAVAVEFSASAEDLARSVHAHPTLSEVVKEAALAVGGRVIHM